VTLRDLATSKLSRAVPSLLAASLTAVAITLVGAGGVAITGVWAPVTVGGGWALAGAAVFIFAGYLFSIMTMRQGDISFIAPFRYSNLIWAIGLGYFVFAEVPDRWMLIGATVVVGTGLYAFHRERVRARTLALASTPRAG